MLKAKVLYKEYDKQVINYMDNLIKMLTKQYGKVNDEFVISLDLIAYNYDIIRKCQQDIQKNGLEKIDDRGRMSKNPSIMICNQAQDHLFKLLNAFGLNLLSKSKMKDIDDSQDDLEELIS